MGILFLVHCKFSQNLGHVTCVISVDQQGATAVEGALLYMYIFTNVTLKPAVVSCSYIPYIQSHHQSMESLPLADSNHLSTPQRGRSGSFLATGLVPTKSADASR